MVLQDMRLLEPVLQHQRFVGENLQRRTVRHDDALVQDDGARDLLYGGGGHDWFLPASNDYWRAG